MAYNNDIVGLLTGTSSARLSPVAPTREQRMLERAGRYSQGMTQSIGQLFGADLRTPAQKLQSGLKDIDRTNPNDLERLAKLQQATGDTTGAARTIAQRNAILQTQELSLEKQKRITELNQQRTQFSEYLDRTYPNKGYGALALQGLITPANMKNFIKDPASNKITMETISVNGKNKLAVFDAKGNITKQYDAKIEGTSNSNVAKYFMEEVVRKGKKVKIMYKREGDTVSEVSILGTSELPDSDDLEKVEVTKTDGQTYVQFHDLSKPENQSLVREVKISENREITEEVDLVTGQKIKYSSLPDGTQRIPFGIVELPKYKIEVQDDGTYDVFNETIGKMEQEGVATRDSANKLIAKKQKTQETLNDIDRQIGFVNEAKTLTESYQLADAVIFHPLMKFVPGSDAKYLQKLTETLQSRIARDTLMELREGSAVGATGLGALNLKELELLQNALGNLDPTVGDARFRKQLDLVKKHYQGFRASLMGRPAEIDWSNPAYREFTKTIMNAQGKPEVYYTLSDETGAPLVDSNGKPLWFRALTPVKKD